MLITVELDRFRPDANDVEGISYMLLGYEILARGMTPDDEIVVITPAGVRYAAFTEYDPMYGTYFVQYTSPVIPEVS